MNFAWITSTIDDLTMNYGDPFLQIGNGMLFWLGVIILLVYAGKWILEGSNSMITGFMHFICLYLVAQTMLHYYNTPLPFSTSSFKHLFPDMAADLANTLNNSRYDQMVSRVVAIADHLERPGWDVWAIATYVMVEVDMMFMGAVLLLPIGLGFIALGMGSLVWPLAIPWIIVPRMSWLFWNGLSYMLKYSFYRVWAAMLTYVWAGIMVQCVDNLVFQDLPGGSYSLAQFTAKTVIALIFLNGCCLWMVVYLPSMLSDWFGGGASGGGRFMPGVVNFVRS